MKDFYLEQLIRASVTQGVICAVTSWSPAKLGEEGAILAQACLSNI